MQDGPGRSELRTIMTADLSGFSGQLRENEEAVIRMLVDGYYAVAEREVARAGGELFRKEGDAIWCSFKSALAAVRASVALQEEVLARNLSQGEETRMGLRVGIHLGDVTMTDDGEVLGHTLSVAKRLETACEEGAVNLSEEVYRQLRGRDVGFRFEDLGEVALKGVGPTRTFQGRITAERLAELLDGRGPSLEGGAGVRVVLGAALDTLAGGEARRAFERGALRVAGELGGEGLVTPGGVVFLLLDPLADLDALLARPELAGPRRVVAVGEVLVRRGEDGTATALLGPVAERALAALGEGREPGVTLLAEELGPRVEDPARLECAGLLPGRDGGVLLRLLDAPGARLQAAFDPRCVATLRGDAARDVVAGVRRGREGGDPRLAAAWAGVAEVAGVAKATPVLSAAAEELAGEADCALAVAAALIASAERVRPPPGTMAVGAVEAGGAGRAAAAPWTPARRAAAGAARVLVVGPGGAPPDLEGPEVVEVADLAALRDFLAEAREDRRVDAVARAARDGRLSVVVAGPAGGEPERAAWAEALARLAGADPEEAREEGAPRLAEDAEAAVGRRGLVDGYRRFAADLGAAALPAQVARAGARGLVTLFPDPRLVDLDGVEVVAVAGDPADEATLVLTEADLEDALAGLGALPARARRRLASDALVYVGAGARDPVLRAFHRQLGQDLAAAPDREVFLVAPGAREADVRRWERRGVRVLEEGLEEVAAACAATPPAAAGEDRELAARALPARPYKFLDSFSGADRAIFFGRDRETEEVAARVLSRPTLVLFGRSGAGKTSLLQAGVLARLGAPRDLCLTLRALGDPRELLRAELAALAPGLVAADADLAAIVGAVASRLTGHLVVVLDQFEEFFVRTRPEARAGIVAELAALARAMPPRAHLVFALREDFLAEMAEFEEALPSILDNRYRLRLLDRAAAREAIVGPAALFGFEVEEALVDALLEELFEEGIDPPQLQIVLDRLWLDRGRGEKALTLAGYRELGGVRRILVGYLQATLAEGLGDEGELARRVLKAMVTTRGTKEVVGLDAVVGRVGEDPARVAEVMDRLVDARLIRGIGEEGAPLFELAHEYLIEEVLSWASAEEISLRHARAVLEGELENWERFGSLMAPDLLAVVERERDRLEPTPAERAVVVRAAALHGRDLDGWLRDPEAAAAGVPVLLEMLGEEDVPGEVKRAMVPSLFPRVEGEEARARLLDAVEGCGNPDLLDALAALPEAAARGALLEAATARVRARFFGEGAMAHVPGGPALLGSTRAEKDARKARTREDLHERFESEPETREVEVGEFWIDRTLVTNAEYAEFDPVHRHRFPPEEADHPAVYVSWHDAARYAAWLGKELPTEEEWEKAARGTDGRIFPWGDEFDPARVNSAESELRRTSPVGHYPAGASPYGCLDMAGNVWEWTASSWKEPGPFKVQKGGSTVNFEPHQYAAARFEGFPDFILQWVGFRCKATRPGGSRFGD